LEQQPWRKIRISTASIECTNRTVLIILFLAGIIVYQNSLTVPFQFDDINYLKDNPGIKSFSALWSMLTASYSAFFDARTFVAFTFFINYKLGGLDVFGYHLVNVIFHIINAFLIYVLFQRYAEPDQEKTPSWKYLIAALVFLVHPINTESVTYLTSRSCVLSLFFILASMLCFSKGTNEGRHWGYYIASIVCFFLALASKRTGIILVPLLLLFDYFYLARDKKMFISRLKFHLPFIIIPVLMSLVLLRYITSYSGHHPWTENTLTELRVIVQYAKLLLFPVGLNIDHDIRPSLFLDSSVVLSLASIVALVFVAFILRKKVPGISFGISWYLFALAPFLVIRVEGFMAERWVYVASIGFSIALSELVMLGAQKYHKTAIAVAGVGILLLGAGTIMRNEVYASPISLWEDTVKKSPEKPRPYLNLSKAYIENGNPQKAIQHIQTALSLGHDRGLEDKEIVAAYMNLAAAYGTDDKKAEEALKSAAPYAAYYHQYYHSLGLLYARTGKDDLAIAAFKKALELVPNSPTLLNQMGNSYAKMNQGKKAKECYILAVNGIPRHGIDYVNQGEAYQKLGDLKKMLAAFFEGAQVDPFDITVRLNLANTLFYTGNLEEAWKQYDIVLRTSPNFAKAYSGMGTILLSQYRYRDAEKYFVKALDLTPSEAIAERQNLLRIVDEVHRRAQQDK
jgi:protein O-mannosyl-transferase